MEGKTEAPPEKSRESEASVEEILNHYILADNHGIEDTEDFKSLTSKSSAEIIMERERLQTQLDELKKENFSIRTSVNAWQHLLEDQLKEFIETNLELNKVYDEIWTERENFCRRADEFDDEFGVLSAWWHKQMKFVSDLENLEKRTLEGKKCREKIKKLEKEVTELGKKIEQFQKENNQHVVEVDVHVAKSSEALRDEEPEKDSFPTELDYVRHELSQIDDEIKVCENYTEVPKHDLFSMVDMETVRKVNQKNRRFKKTIFTELKKSMFK